MKKNFSIHKYDFSPTTSLEIQARHHDFLSWPLVYFLNNDKSHEAYVGETTDVISRLSAHSKSTIKKKNTAVYIVLSELFNKSAALDLESYLIRYISADGRYKLQNANLGVSNHQYYQRKDLYWSIFRDIWDELRKLGVAQHSLEHIDNTDLFKYSPYKSLSSEQVQSLKTILHCLNDNKSKTSLIQGGAGTGKSILAIFVFKLLKTNLEDFNFSDFDENDAELFQLIKDVKIKYDSLSMALVIPMASFRKTIARVFSKIKGLSSKMVIGPSDLSKGKYDLVIVDEGHRLRQRVNLGPYFKTFDKTCVSLRLNKSKSTELDWVIKQSKKSIIFYDQYQSIKPSDAPRKQFINLERQPTTRKEVLKSQFRSKGGVNFVNLIHNLLDGKVKEIKPLNAPDFEFKLFDSPFEMVSEIKSLNNKMGLCRVVAGYAWQWVSKKNKSKFDIILKDINLKWNSVSIDWVNSPNSIDEAGCIHTTQGYDLNYVGVIIGPEIDYDVQNKEIIIYKDRYKDKAGKNTISDESILKDYIINIYKTILLRGINGVYVYAVNQNMQDYLAKYIAPFNTPIEQAEFKFYDYPAKNTVPFYDLKIAAGDFSEQQNYDEIKYLEVKSISVTGKNYFACKVYGESMNKIIPDGSICLFERDGGGTRNGKIVLVSLNGFVDPDLGTKYTIKEYSSKKSYSETSFKHVEIKLSPKSTFEYEPIVLRNDEASKLSVVGMFVKVLEP